jgi:hypothetical protein
LNSVGRGGGSVEDDVADELAVEESLDTEIYVCLRAGDGGAEVVVAVADRDVGRCRR